MTSLDYNQFYSSNLKPALSACFFMRVDTQTIMLEWIQDYQAMYCFTINVSFY